MRRLVLVVLLLVALGVAFKVYLPFIRGTQQLADENYDTKVAKPAYLAEHPRVVIDEAHRNFHTAEGRYKPLADLLRSDGYEVAPGKQPFTAEFLKSARVLVVANALGPGANDDTSPPAFTQAECEVVRDWVRAGGSLLLISDHTPMGAAAEMLGRAVGVQFGKGFVFSLDPKATYANPTFLRYSRANGLLADHPITRGRDDSERVNAVIAFTGQSLGVPEGATALMKLPSDAHEAPTRSAMPAALQAARTGRPDATPSPVGPAQGVAFELGRGRVVVLGEAAMMSAQVVRSHTGDEHPMGMNAPGSDDRQFALNTLHWLSGLLK
jgi:hypothetical protein